MMTHKQQQRLLGTLLLVFIIAVLAYFVLTNVRQADSELSSSQDEQIQFTSIIEPVQEKADDEEPEITGLEDTTPHREAFVDINPPNTSSQPIDNSSVAPIPDLSQSDASQPEKSVNVAPKPEPVVDAVPSVPAERDISSAGDSQTKWVLQLGSFSVEENATSLKKQLEDLGYQPMIEQSRTNDSIIYRVRLQPKTDRAALEKTAQTIAKQLNLNTQIFQYP